MHRARPPDARCLANATSPLLPFLAPRAFLESPFRRARSRWASGSVGSVPKEESTVTIRKFVELPNADSPWIRAVPAGSSRKPGNNPSRSSNARRRQELRPSVPLSKRYAEISAFTNVKIRKHATERLWPWRETGPRRARKVAQAEVSEAGPERSLAVRAKYTQPTRGGALAENRRKKALKLAEARLKQYMSRQKEDADPEILKLDGRYRSLTRRVLNFQRTSKYVFYTGIGFRRPGWPRDRIVSWGLATLDRRVYPAVRRSCHFLYLRHDVRCTEWVSQLWRGVEAAGEERLYQNWLDMAPVLRNQIWHLVLLYLLDRQPLRALQFLKVLGQTFQPSEKRLPHAHVTILADAFEHLGRRFWLDRSPDGQDGVTTSSESSLLCRQDHIQFVPAFWHSLGPFLEWHPRLCSQDLLWNIARLATKDDLKVIFDQLVGKNVFMLYHTLLGYANIFAEHNEHQYSLRCLNMIVKNLPNLPASSTVDNKMFRWSCALVLRKSLNDPESYHLTSSIVAEFLRFGVKLDTLLYNVIIHNAMDAKDPATAFNVYDLLEKEGLKPDMYTYNIMLHGCTMQDDPALFRDFAEHCRQTALKSQDPYLATNYLFYVAQNFSDSTLAATPERKVLDTYLEFFQPGPLSPFLGQPVILREGLIKPTVPAIFLVLQAMIKNALSLGNKNVWHMYQAFIHILHKGEHPLLRELATETYIWNAFLLAFCKGQQFANASRLIKMLSESKHPELMLPQPDLISWNIFLAAFFKTDQVEAAERVFEIMRSRGVEPDQYTYSTLVLGYARAQHLEKLGQVLPSLHQETQLAPILLAALAKIHRRGELMKRLEVTRVLRERDENQKANDRLHRQKERWVRPNYRPRPGIQEHDSNSSFPGAEGLSEPGRISRRPLALESLQNSRSEQQEEESSDARATESTSSSSTDKKQDNWKPSRTPAITFRRLKDIRRGYTW